MLSENLLQGEETICRYGAAKSKEKTGRKRMNRVGGDEESIAKRGPR